MEKTKMEEINYWLFSDADQPRFARAGGEYPLELLRSVTDEEAEQICAKIRERLEKGKFYVIYVNILVFFNDKSAPDILRRWKQYFEERQRIGIPAGCNFSYEIRLVKNAIKQLKKVKD